MINALAIPFHREAYDGFGYTNGFIKIQADHLLVEYQTKDALLGVVKTAIKAVELNYNEIGEVKYKSNLFRTVIVITVSSFKVSSELGNGSGDIKFFIKRKNRKLAEEFVDNLKLHVAEYQLKMLEKGTSKDQDLLSE